MIAGLADDRQSPWSRVCDAVVLDVVTLEADVHEFGRGLPLFHVVEIGPECGAFVFAELIHGQRSTSAEDALGANGPACTRKEMDQCSDRDCDKYKG